MAIETPKSPIIPIFLVICFLGLLLTGAGGAYLYFKWETHYPPLSELQDQVRAARATSEAEEAAEKDFERTGVPEWTEQLNEQYESRANEMAKRMERDLAKAQATAEAAETGGSTRSPQGGRNLADIQKALAEQRSSAETGAAISKTIPEVEVEATPLKSGGTIEKMNDEWLPPGVSKSE